jgi:hypothetical protein
MTKRIAARQPGLFLDYHNVPLGACQIPPMGTEKRLWLLLVWSKV